MRIRRALGFVAVKLREVDAYDLIGLVGLAFVGVGLWWLAPWISFTVIGVFLLVIAFMGAARPGRKGR